jgi:hypothetical protein
LGKVYVLPYTAFLIINKILDAFIFRYTWTHVQAG